MSGAPIRLGSAQIGGKLVFETGSTVKTSLSGIQSVDIKCLCPDGANVFNLIPANGTPYNQVFGNNYLPADFKVNLQFNQFQNTGGGAQIEWLPGNAARITISFARAIPNNPPSISVDSVLNYKSVLGQFGAPYFLAASGVQQPGIIGFPEPLVTKKYNAITPPPIAGGSISSLYAKPTDIRAAGFPDVSASIVVPLNYQITEQFIKANGGTVPAFYWNGTASVQVNITKPTTFYFNATFVPNPLGWQLVKLKWAPVAGQAFFDVEEDWRTFYFFSGVAFVKITNP